MPATPTSEPLPPQAAPPPAPATRRSLLSRVRDFDDHEGWREFFDAYWRLIHNFALRSGLSDADAQDVAQETLVSVAKKMPGFEYDPGLGSFKGWLLIQVRRRIIDHFRRGANRRKNTISLDVPGPNGQTESMPIPVEAELEAVWQEEWQKNCLQGAIRRVQAKVSARQFLIFDMAILRATPTPLIAKKLDISLAQVYLARHRVGRLLKIEMRIMEQGL